MRRALALSTSVVAMAGALAGCGSLSVSKSDLEKKISSSLAAKAGGTVPIITCPGDLQGKVGISLQCKLGVKGDPHHLPVTVTVTSVKGSQVDFSSKVGTTPIQ